MPERPRNHVIETTSERIFEALIPAEWVVRPVSSDYGIDREVEIFVDGSATGLTFKVQLKGTDHSGRTQRVRRDSLEYWLALDVPVLLVTVEVKSGVVRGRWIHSVGSDGPNPGSDKLTIRMDSAINIGPDWLAGLADDLRTVRQLRSGYVPTPLPIHLRANHPHIPAADLGILRTAILQAGGDMNRLVPSDDARRSVTIDVESSRISLALPTCWSTLTIHLETEIATIDDLLALGTEVFLAIAALVANVNPESAAALASQASPESELWAVLEVAERLGPALIGSGHASFLLTVIEQLSHEASPQAKEAVDLYTVALVSRPGTLESGSFANLSASLEVGACADGRADWNTGRQLFNLAHLHKARREFERALELFERAAALDPRYRTDAGWLRDFGSCAWEIGKFDASARAYDSALAAGFDAYELRPLLADSLMYAGQYKKALAALDDWEPTGDERDRVGILRQIALGHICEKYGIEAQSRKRMPSHQLRSAIEAVDSTNALEQTVAELLRANDALDPRLWLALGDADHLAQTSVPLLIAAMLLQDERIWCLALLAALDAEFEEQKIRAICIQGRRECGKAFYDEVLDWAQAQSATNKARLLRVVSTAFSEPLHSPPMRYRLVNSPDADDWILDEILIDGAGQSAGKP